MTGLVFITVYKEKDYDLLQAIGTSFVMDFILLLFFFWRATMHNMWAIYLINIMFDVPVLAVYKNYYKWNMSTYMCTLVPDIYWLILALVCR